ncbi:head-to-tail connector [Mycobacterium phage JoshKayV]|uniref:Head-to-tail connector n=1 Tax=Mycobacterium phage JoshKayV TaxID=2024294 RepID=A0A249XTP7_9CAUD|nr:head-tail connector protein [Mycobacterium phage JoshKayV]ASZ75359.1 head-to-tail connector [Mycobacterium phage JoshKayV]
MRIRSTTNGGFADVDPEYAQELIASGLFEDATPKPPRKAPAKKAAPRKQTAPKQEPTTEE